jgi:hypothetical protein
MLDLIGQDPLLLLFSVIGAFVIIIVIIKVAFYGE